MDPISSNNPVLNNPLFSYDFDRFVLQNPHVHFIQNQVDIKPFDIKPAEKTEKSKKDLKKNKEKQTKEQSERNDAG